MSVGPTSFKLPMNGVNASFHNLLASNQINENAAWYYPSPMEGSVEKVKKDFKDYIAFWRGVEVKE